MAAGQGWINVTFQMVGQQELVGRFAAWGAAVQTQMQPAWEQVGERLQEDFALQFTNEGGYLGAQVGPAWAQLRPATVADRIRKGYPGSHPILYRTGSLRDSLVVRGAPDNVFEATDHSVKVGTTSKIGPFHQYGTHGRSTGRMRHDFYSAAQGKYLAGHPEGAWVDTEIRSGGMPARVMVGLRWQTRSDIIRILGDFVRMLARQAGLRAMGGGSSAP